MELPGHAKVEGQSALTPDEIAQLDRNFIHSCAGNDGGAPTDDFLSDPRLCHFNPATVPLCGVKATAGCLTQPKLDALKMLYAGPVNPRTKERIYAPIPTGSEASNLGLAYQETPTTARQVLYPLLWAFGGAFDPMKFDFDRDEATLDDKLAAIVNANNPDLTEFRAHGGKLILYTGTADPIVPYTDEISYYERVVDYCGCILRPACRRTRLRRRRPSSGCTLCRAWLTVAAAPDSTASDNSSNQPTTMFSTRWSAG